VPFVGERAQDGGEFCHLVLRQAGGGLGDVHEVILIASDCERQLEPGIAIPLVLGVCRGDDEVQRGEDAVERQPTLAALPESVGAGAAFETEAFAAARMGRVERGAHLLDRACDA
jgi:hypothetical protein